MARVEDTPSGAPDDVFDHDPLNGAVAGRVILPFPGVEGDVVIVRITSDAPDVAIAGWSVHVHAVSAVLFKGDVLDGEGMGVRQMHAEGPALSDGQVPHRDAADAL